jgi:hypothetical protein
VVTFGESSTDYRKNKINPTFFLYKQRFPEKRACEHVGIIPSGNFSSTLRTKEMIRKGKESVASLMNVGVRPGGLNPICGAEVWKSIGLAKVLYGAQIWWNFTKTDLKNLDEVNRLAAKRMAWPMPNNEIRSSYR